MKIGKIIPFKEWIAENESDESLDQLNEWFKLPTKTIVKSAADRIVSVYSKNNNETHEQSNQPGTKN